MAISYSINELKELAERLTSVTNLPYHELTHSFFKRRLALLFEKKAIRKTQQFISLLEEDYFIDAVNDEFAIATTELFRDPGFWRKLRRLITDSNIKLDQQTKVWIPNVTSGEELYSFLILLEEAGLSGQFEIMTSHISKLSINRVQEGIISTKKAETNNYNYKRFEGNSKLDNYFGKDKCIVCLKKELLNNVKIESGFFPHEDKEHKASIVIFRNKMLYYNKSFHEKLVERIDRNTKPGGIVCFGINETIPKCFSKRFECIDEKESIYRKYKFLTD
ncbi:MAG: hypothetical protein JEZ14_04095 [Marinilabiliaceae bacterium]|nr:hypothetical protein [Marinilabiliaceae bacterium]